MDFLCNTMETTERIGCWEKDKKIGLWRLITSASDNNTTNAKWNVYTDNPNRLIKVTVVDTFVDTSRIFIREINSATARDMVERNHYSHKLSLCSVALGVFYKKDVDPNSFFEDDVEELIGCIVYGNPVGRSAAASISTKLNIDEVYELTRLWIADIPGCKNLESFCIGQSFEWLRKNRPKIKALLSYADNEAGHTGIIYQSTNWLYQGNSQLALMPNYSISLTGPDEGYNWVHSRTVHEKWGSHNVDFLKKVIGRNFWRKKESQKHRYVYILLKGKERKNLIKNLKHKIYPYPKKHEYVDDIEEIVVGDNNTKLISNESFFVNSF